MSMLAFAMTCLRADCRAEPMELIMAGRYQEAVQLAMPRLDRKPSPQQVQEHAALGQVIGRALIRLGRAEAAEELFRRQLHTYEMGPRAFVRWMSSLDHGEIQLVMNRPSRAAQAFSTVADDETAPIPMRVEALAGLAISVRALGEYRRARHALQHAQTLARQEAPEPMQRIIEGLLLETAVMQELRTFDEGGELSSQSAMRTTDTPLHAQLLACAQSLADVPMAAARLEFLAALVDHNTTGARYLSRLLDHINQLRQHKLAEEERESRVEAALARVAAGDAQAAQELLGGLVHDEEAIRKQRHSLELRYCLSRIYALQGRHVDALRLYKEHVAQVLSRLHTELAHLPYLRCLERQEMLEQNDATKLLLPLRYRRAYQYIMEHLNDRDLSVREVAAHVDVTERALQMAFRTHLGMSPAELIRRRRVEHIRKDLRQGQERRTVIDVAQRWGVSNRSTLTQTYRQMFHETPTTMLRGVDAPLPTAPREDLQ
jgi:AraC-like DNA-binding protein